MDKTEYTFYYLKTTDDGDYVDSGQATMFGDDREDARAKLKDFMEDCKEEDYHTIELMDFQFQLTNKINLKKS